MPSSMPGFGCFGKQTRKTTRVEVEFDGRAGGDFD
eukprot:COSAG02_NODE_62906_length_264_cov_1.248485_1_plen_34_part_01